MSPWQDQESAPRASPTESGENNLGRKLVLARGVVTVGKQTRLVFFSFLIFFISGLWFHINGLAETSQLNL